MSLRITDWVSISEQSVYRQNELMIDLSMQLDHEARLHSLYKHLETTYPKFYKMDLQSKLAWLNAELLLKDQSLLTQYDKQDIGIVFSNASSSLNTDEIYWKERLTIEGEFIPSPSIFVYTLPNIMIGEIAIRHKITGENNFFVSRTFNAQTLCNYVQALISHELCKAVVVGWVELYQNHYKSFMAVVQPSNHENDLLLNEQNLIKIYNQN